MSVWLAMESVSEVLPVRVSVLATLSARAAPASALPSAVAMAESAAHAEDSVLAPGSACSSLGLQSGWAVSSAAVALVFLRRVRRNLRSTCSRTKGGKGGTLHAVLHARCWAQQGQQARPRWGWPQVPAQLGGSGHGRDPAPVSGPLLHLAQSKCSQS